MVKLNKNHIIGLAIVILAALIFLPLGHVEFLTYDDEIHITKNMHFSPISWGSLYDIWKAPYAGLYIPISYTLWGCIAFLLQLFSGPNWQSQNMAWPFLLLNFTSHLVNTFLVYLLLRKILLSINFSIKKESVLFGTLIFLFHPIQAESVAWISAFRDTICVTFSLLTVLAYINKKYFWTYVGILVSILCKPTAVILPLLVIAFDFWGPEVHRTRKTAKTYFYYASLLMVSVPFGILAKFFQPDRPHHNIPDLVYRPLIALDAVGFYLKKVFWPFEFGPDYGRKPLWVLSNLPTIESLFPILFFGAILWFIQSHKQLKNLGILAVALLIVPLVPVLGVVPFHFQKYSTVADRYFYFSMLSVGLIGALAYSLLPKAKWLFALILLLLIYSTFVHTQYWRSQEEFVRHKVEVNPYNDAAQTNLGLILANKNQKHEALSRFERALDLNPANFAAASNIGTILMDLGESTKALNHFTKTLESFPDNVEARVGYGILLSKLEKVEDALNQLKLATETDPNNAFAWFNYGTVLSKTGKTEESLHCLRRAVEISPFDENYKNQLSAVEQYLKSKKDR